MNIYFRIVISLAIIACIYGLLVPFLISMKDTVAVISGFALTFLTPPCIYAIYKGL
ncbi:TPA: hypothetical protein ACV75M_004755, partial [Escherichia coli]